MKRPNSYQAAIARRLYAETPKAVFAALAASYIINHHDADAGELNLDAELLDEWRLLYEQGIVPQAPPRRKAA
jgi:hypothetical protein